MPLPPLYYPVYPMHFRLPEPGLHANPLLQTPPMFHLEGLHTLRWIQSDDSNFSKTVLGDHQALALRNYDSGSYIPHLPLPLSAGPFLLDTLNNSKYVVLFHQPNLELDGSAAGVFFWGLAPPRRCFELELPLPKFLAKRSRGGALRKAHQASVRIEKAREKLMALEDALGRDDVTPSRDAELRKQVAREKKAMTRAQETASKQFAAYEDAYRVARDVDDGAGKPEPVSPFQSKVRDHQINERVRTELEAEHGQRVAKHSADARARQARIEAERHEASALAIGRGAVGARGGVAGTPEQASEHEARAAKLRAEESQHGEAARQHEAAAKAHRKSASLARKAKSQQAYRDESARQYQDEHGEKRNPYKDATGVGNVSVALPSLLAHVPVPSTVQIYMSWTALLVNWCRVAASMALDMLKGYVGFVFDNILPPGQGAVAAWAMDFAKGLVSGTAIGVAQKYVLEDQVSFKVTQKAGPLSVSGEMKKDPKTGEWGWKVSVKPSDQSRLPGPFEASADSKGTPPKIFGHSFSPVDYHSGSALSGAPAP